MKLFEALEPIPAYALPVGAMQTAVAPSKSRKDQAAHLLAARLREHYGERLWGVVRIFDNPYEAQHFEAGIYVVAVLEGDVEPFPEIGVLHRITDALNAELDYEVLATAYAISRQAYEEPSGVVARNTRQEGQAL